MTSAIVSILLSLLSLYTLILLIRVVFDWVQLFARSWRPTGIVLLAANLVYALTDSPLRWVRRALPILRVGTMGLDLSFIVLFLGIIVLQRVLLLLV